MNKQGKSAGRYPFCLSLFSEKKNLTTRFHKTVTGRPGDEAF
jgi:hypothetical protein